MRLTNIFIALIGGLIAVSLLSCGTTNSTSTSTPTNEAAYVVGNLLVLVNSQNAPGQLEEDFKIYDLRSKGQASRTQLKYSFTFNQAAISGEKFVRLLDDHDAVIEATFTQPGQQ